MLLPLFFSFREDAFEESNTNSDGLLRCKSHRKSNNKTARTIVLIWKTEPKMSRRPWSGYVHCCQFSDFLTLFSEFRDHSCESCSKRWPATNLGPFSGVIGDWRESMHRPYCSRHATGASVGLSPHPRALTGGPVLSRNYRSVFECSLISPLSRLEHGQWSDANWVRE